MSGICKFIIYICFFYMDKLIYSNVCENTNYIYVFIFHIITLIVIYDYCKKKSDMSKFITNLIFKIIIILLYFIKLKLYTLYQLYFIQNY